MFESALTPCATAAVLWFVEDRPVAAWAAMGIGALTKGPIALAIPLLVVVPHALVTGAAVRRLVPWPGVAAVLVLGLPWFVAGSLRHPQFPHYVFGPQRLQRPPTPTLPRTSTVAPAGGLGRAAAEKGAIRPTAVRLGIVVLVSAAVGPLAGLRHRARLALLGYAIVVLAIPFVSGELLAAVGEDRSSATVAGATAAALERAGGGGAGGGIPAYPPSLPFYLRRPIAAASASAGP